MSEQLREDVKEVTQGHAGRIARPGRWVVYRMDDGRIKIEILK